MAKKDLLGGSLWDNYSKKVSERMNHPKFLGEITEEGARKLGAELVIADWGAESCGDAVRLFWAVDSDSDTIKDAKFKSFGCGTAIASSDIMSEMCIGLTVDEALKITNIDVEKALRDDDDTPAVPPQKMHCSVMAYDVIKKAASLYKNVDMALLEEDDIVCECARVSLKTIKEVIRINDLTEIEQITQYTKAGAFCKSCIKPGGHEERKYYLEDILRETRGEMDRERFADGGEDQDFASLTIIQKHRLIEKILDEKIRGKLASDGGMVEVVDMKDTETGVDIYIRYKGACAGCASSTTTTLFAITSELQDSINSDIQVFPV
jgi:NifU-like protein